MPPPVLVNTEPRGAGSKSVPVVVTYGTSVRISSGVTLVDVAVMSSRCLLMRYWAAVTVIWSSVAITVIEVRTGEEVRPPVFVAVMLRLISCCPTGTVGAMAVSVAVLGPVEVIVRLSSALAGDWVALKVRACAGTFGSVPLSSMRSEALENTEMGGTGFTAGAPGSWMVMLVLVVAEPQELVTVRLAVTGDTAPTALKIGLAAVVLEREPLLTVQRND